MLILISSNPSFISIFYFYRRSSSVNYYILPKVLVVKTLYYAERKRTSCVDMSSRSSVICIIVFFCYFIWAAVGATTGDTWPLHINIANVHTTHNTTKIVKKNCSNPHPVAITPYHLSPHPLKCKNSPRIIVNGKTRLKLVRVTFSV